MDINFEKVGSQEIIAMNFLVLSLWGSSNGDLTTLHHCCITYINTGCCRAQQALGKSEVWKLLQLVVQEWPLLIQAAFFLVVAAIADVLIPHYISQTISMSLRLSYQLAY